MIAEPRRWLAALASGTLASFVLTTTLLILGATA